MENPLSPSQKQQLNDAANVLLTYKEDTATNIRLAFAIKLLRCLAINEKLNIVKNST